MDFFSADFLRMEEDDFDKVEFLRVSMKWKLKKGKPVVWC